MTSLLFFGALALAGPASAQLVNGIAGPNYHGDAPIGTKAGGSLSPLKAPGEAAAIAGARRNEMEAKGIGARTVTMRVRPSAIRRHTVTQNEFSRAKTRLEKDSD